MTRSSLPIIHHRIQRLILPIHPATYNPSSLLKPPFPFIPPSPIKNPYQVPLTASNNQAWSSSSTLTAAISAPVINHPHPTLTNQSSTPTTPSPFPAASSSPALYASLVRNTIETHSAIKSNANARGEYGMRTGCLQGAGCTRTRIPGRRIWRGRFCQDRDRMIRGNRYSW